MDVVVGLARARPRARPILTYRAEVKVKGRLAILGEMVLRATAGMMIGEVTKCLRSQLEAAGRGDRRRSGDASMTRRGYDLIVVGGGTAGCVVAGPGLGGSGPPRAAHRGRPGSATRPRRRHRPEAPDRARPRVRRTSGCTTSSATTARASRSCRAGSWAAARRSTTSSSSARCGVDFDAWAAFGGTGLVVRRAAAADAGDRDGPRLRRQPDPRLERAAGPRTARSSSTIRPIRRSGRCVEAAHAFGLPDCPDLNVPEPFGDLRVALQPGRRQAPVDRGRVSRSGAGPPEPRDPADTTVTRLVLDGDRVRGVEIADGATARP